MESQRATVYRDRKTDRYGEQGKAIRRTSDASPPSVWDVRADHGLADTFVEGMWMAGGHAVAGTA